MGICRSILILCTLLLVHLSGCSKISDLSLDAGSQAQNRPSDGSGGESIPGYIVMNRTSITADDNGLTLRGSVGAVVGKRICLVQVPNTEIIDYRNFTFQPDPPFIYELEEQYYVGRIEINEDGSFEQNWPRPLIDQYVAVTGQGARTLVAYLPETADEEDDPWLTCDNQFATYLASQSPTAGYLRVTGAELLSTSEAAFTTRLKTLFED